MKRSFYILFSLALAGFSTNAQNVGGIWVSAPGMPGDGNGIHKGEFQVLAIQDSVKNVSTSSGGASIGKILFGNFSLKKMANTNSGLFFSSVGKGTLLPQLAFKFYVRQLNGQFAPCLTLTLFNAVVVKYKITSTENNNLLQPYEEINLFYNKIQLTDSTGNSTIIQNSVQ